MLTLIVRQSLKNGTAKSWKIRSESEVKTFGSSRNADLISIAPSTPNYQGVFEYRNNAWWFTRTDFNSVESIKVSPSVKITEDQDIEFDGYKLHCSPQVREANLYKNLETRNVSTSGKQFQLFIAKQNDQVLETRLLPLNKKYRPSFVAEKNSVACIQSSDWHSTQIGDLTIKQKTISMEDASRLASVSVQDFVDKDSKKAVYFVLGFTAIIMGFSLFGPKSKLEDVTVQLPKAAQSIIVKTETKPKPKKQESAPKKMAQAPAPSNQKQAPTGGSKVANMMKSLSGGRMSQLLGKVSAQAAKSGNVIVGTGVKAGSGASGRALAAVGNMDRSGRDWGRDGSGSGVVISTAGRGGGGNAAGMGGLAAGATGSGGVGLIEEESEITGGLDREIIAQYIKSKLGQILYCYERQLSANPDLFGKVAVKFTIGSTGQVEQQLIGDTTLKNSNVEGCILNRVASWKFPAPQGGTKVLVTYPFLFKSTN